MSWFRATYPDLTRCLRVSQSGRRSGGSRRAAIAWSSQVSQGAVLGESDIAILLPRGKFGSLLIEHKAQGSKHPTSEDQLAYVEFHCKIGNCAVVTRGIEAAKTAIQTYLAGAP